MNDELVKSIEMTALSAFRIGAREVAMMALDGDLEGLEVEAAVERARVRALARMDSAPWLEAHE